MSDLDSLKKRQKEISEFLQGVKTHLNNNFEIEGKTILEWRKFFTIEIPEEVTFAVLVELSKEIAYKYQRAAYFRDNEMVQSAFIDQSKFEKYYETYNDVRVSTQQKTGKPLAAESCKVAAILATKNFESGMTQQKAIKDFWIKTCDVLTEMRKLVELMGYALSSDARVQRDFVVRGDNK
jgi:hypothetical protein